ncbi:MAG: sn-glycerol-1-phosphate dehydrogenase [Ruminococcaceae bacterium]|nr:sn-glycerol-1-phosphate dehydrogenase [Oscillospiraceae bacterium]
MNYEGIKMSEIMKIIKDFSTDCPCGKEHTTTVKDIRIGSGLVCKTGKILCENNFPKNILVVADENTLQAAKGIEEALAVFNVEKKIYSNIRVADMKHVEELEELIKDKDIAVLSVGTGSVNDPCRLACARQNKLLCIFATAPSMDGFASDSSPIVEKGFKSSYPAKSPEVIIGDTKILAAAPSYLKSAGFGDMIAKYVGLIDWRISALLTGEYYCERVASLTKNAVDSLMQMAHLVTTDDENTAGKIFESLLMTGIAMSFTKNSRPASGSEHIIAHLIECLQLPDGIIPNYHGEDVGVCTLEMLKFYNELAENKNVTGIRENVDWEKVFEVYGDMAENVRSLNFPENIVDTVIPELIGEKWEKITEIIRSVPSYEECKDAMRKAGCKITVSDIEKEQSYFDLCVKYSPYMRKRLTLLRLRDMIKT